MGASLRAGQTQSLSANIYNTIQHRLFQTEQNYIATTSSTQHWDGWKGGGQKNNRIVVHPQHWLIYTVKVKKNERDEVQIILMHLIESQYYNYN